MGKGDTPRPTDKEKYDANYERVFGKGPLKTDWDPPKVGQRSGSDGRESNGLPKEPDGRSDPGTSETVEGERCPCPVCSEGTVTQIPESYCLWCEKCGSEWFLYGNICPKCGRKVFRRRGPHFDHEHYCGHCHWTGELE